MNLRRGGQPWFVWCLLAQIHAGGTIMRIGERFDLFGDDSSSAPARIPHRFLRPLWSLGHSIIMAKYSKCECELRNWKKRFFRIRGSADKIAAVNQLVALAVEMRGFWPDTRRHRSEWAEDLERVKVLTVPEDAGPPDRTLMFPSIPEKLPVPISFPLKASQEDPAILGDVIPMETTIEPVAPVQFGGILEGRNPIGCTPPRALPVVTGPVEIEIEIYAYCPNPRLLAGKTHDGTIVSVWKGPRSWRMPQKIVCRRDPGQQILTPI